jgi:L,D-transpeptidase YcbB
MLRSLFAGSGFAALLLGLAVSQGSALAEEGTVKITPKGAAKTAPVKATANKPIAKNPVQTANSDGFSESKIRAVIASKKKNAPDPVVTGNLGTTGSVTPNNAVPAQGLPADTRAAAAPVRSMTEEPVFGRGAYTRVLAAHKRYEAIEAAGGWNETPAGVMTLRKGSKNPLVLTLRQRLAVSGDLAAADAAKPVFDDSLAAAIRTFQFRHGLTQTGLVGKLTLRQLNVPIETRINQLAASAHRLYGNGFSFGERYVAVNIPGAAVEAVEGGYVAHRYVAVVGKPERPSPVIQARITSVNLNPNWTAPNVVIKNDIADKVLANPDFLAENKMRILKMDAKTEIDPATIDWKKIKTTVNVPFLLRQDPGPLNALGAIKIDMPNKLAVYMHDTPKKELFRSDVRFHSSGCARVEGVMGLATWLLEPEAIDRDEIEARIGFGDNTQLKLKKQVPVAWVYLTGWQAPDGMVHFRDDIYGLDTYEGIEQTTIRHKVPAKPVVVPKKTVSPATAAPVAR